MSMTKFGFVGIGNMGGAVASVACKGIGAENVVVFNPTTAKAEAFAAAHPGCTVAGSNRELAEACDVVVLGVKPQIVASVLEDLAPTFANEVAKGHHQVVASIAAGWTLAQYDELLAKHGLELPVCTCMPNMPIRVGQGIILMCSNGKLTKNDEQTMLDAFAPAGLVEFVKESIVASATPVFSCSPAMTYIYIESLADGGVQIGLERKDAVRYAAQAVIGAATLALEGEKHTGELRDELATPCGMTITATNEMERRGFRAAVSTGIVTAYEHGKNMK